MALTLSEHEADTGQVSDWIEVTQAMIDAFADFTGDRRFIHVDPDRAAATPFGGTVAHGFFTPKIEGRTKPALVAEWLFQVFT